MSPPGELHNVLANAFATCRAGSRWGRLRSPRLSSRYPCGPHWLDRAVGTQESYRVGISWAEGLALVTVDAPQPKEKPPYVTAERIAGLAGIGKPG